LDEITGELGIDGRPHKHLEGIALSETIAGVKANRTDLNSFAVLVTTAPSYGHAYATPE
jgi:hypothetical protein